MKLSSENVICETVKKAEDSDDIIIRLYEAHNTQEKVKLTFGADFKEAYVCDLLENNISKAETNGREITLPVKGYEIVTLKICR